LKGGAVVRSRWITQVAVVVAVAAAAGGLAPAAAGASSRARPAKVDVVAAFYPLAFVAERVGGKRVSVTNLTPTGAEPHDLELTPKQRDAIDGADLVLVLGSGFQPAVEKAAASRSTGTVELLTHVRARDPKDPHVWLDPTLMQGIVDQTTKALTRADPSGAATYAANAAALSDELRALDARYRGGLADCDRSLLVTAHRAFGYLAQAYGLRQEGVSGLSPDVEPDPKRLAELSDLVARAGVTTVFTEDLVSPRIAQTLAREAGGLRTAVLSPLEGLTAAQQARGDDYLSVMDTNLARIRRALGCR
jgi:zinc transport system substrate-binding protein